MNDSFLKRIDFHIHTLPSPLDHKFNFIMEKLENYVNDLGLDAIAITNHDFIDLNNFYLIKKFFGNRVKVFPGSEVKLKGGHLLVVTDEDNAAELNDYLIKLDHISMNLPDEHDFLSVFENIDKYLLIPDSGKSNSYMSDTVNSKLSNNFRAGDSGSSKNFNRLLKQDGGLTPVLFSDLHASDDERSNYTVSKTTYLKVDTLSISNIKLALEDKTNVFLTSDQTRKDVSNFFIDHKTVSASDKMNLIIGKRGSGKTHLIETLKESSLGNTLYIKQGALVKDSTEAIFYQELENENKHYTEAYMEQLKPIFVEAEHLVQVKDVSGKADKFIQSIKNFAKGNSDKDSASAIPIFDSTELVKDSSRGLDSILKSITRLKNVKNSRYKSAINKYISQENLECLEEGFRAEQRYTSQKNYLVEKAEETRAALRKNLEQISSQSLPDPDNFSLFEWISRKKKIELMNYLFKTVIIKEHTIKSIKISDYFTLKIITRPYKNAQELLDQIGRNEEISESFNAYYKKDDFFSFLIVLKDKKFFSKAPAWQLFLKVDYILLNDNNVPVSGGQRAEYELFKKLDYAHNYDLVLIDEPEASFDNPFLTNKLIKVLKDISEQTTVFVITHSSSIGPLLNPDYIFITKLIDTQYHILVGLYNDGIVKDIQSDQEEPLYDNILELMEAGQYNWHKKGLTYDDLKSFR